MELLYGTVPMYHLNLEELEKHGDEIQCFYEVFSPHHQMIGDLAMTDFEVISDERDVQRSVFGDRIEVIANFSDYRVDYHGLEIKPMSAVITDLADGSNRVYSSISDEQS